MDFTRHSLQGIIQKLSVYHQNYTFFVINVKGILGFFGTNNINLATIYRNSLHAMKGYFATNPNRLWKNELWNLDLFHKQR